MLSQYGIMNIIYHNLGCFLSHGVETHINEMSDALNIYRYFVHDKCSNYASVSAVSWIENGRKKPEKSCAP